MVDDWVEVDGKEREGQQECAVDVGGQRMEECRRATRVLQMNCPRRRYEGRDKLTLTFVFGV